MPMFAPFEQVAETYVRALNGLTSEAVERHPGGDPARWNVRQVVEHLLLTYRRSGSAFRERLEKGRPTEATPTAKQRWRRVSLLVLRYFPSGVEAPAMVRPAPLPETEMDGAGLARWFAQELGAMDDLLLRCEREFGPARFATHPILGPLSAAEWRRFHAVHARHHVKQVLAASRVPVQKN